MDKNIYNLYITFGTLPALYSQLNIFLDNTPSYVWVRSGGAFIPDEYFPSNLKFYKKFDGFNDNDFFETQYKNIIEQINIIRKENKNAEFNIFCDDSRIQFLLKIIIPLDLEPFINKIIIISEGSITESMSRVVNDTYFETKKLAWENLIKLSNDKKTSKTDLNNKLSLMDNYSFYLSTLDKFEYLIPNLNLLLSETNLGNIKIKMNLSEINFSNLYNKLSTKIREQFVLNALGDIEIKKRFENINNKILIINGTYDFANEEITTFIYSTLINKVIDDYGKNYTLFYKAHPLFPVNKNLNFLKFLNNNNIYILPEKTPLEIVLWEYDNIKVGGFCSSIHSLINKKQVEFLFGDLNGFSKYIFKTEFNNYYNLNLSQDFASISLNYYYKFLSFMNRVSLLEGKDTFLEDNLNSIKKINNELKESINNIQKNNENEVQKNEKNILLLTERINYLEKFIKLIKLPLYPII